MTAQVFHGSLSHFQNVEPDEGASKENLIVISWLSPTFSTFTKILDFPQISQLVKNFQAVDTDVQDHNRLHFFTGVV